jgi:t-SNARE complex subunit (syntaxin)
MPPPQKGGPAKEDGDDRDSITQEFLSSFNKEKSAIEQSIDAVANATRQINSLSQQQQTAFNPEDLEKISAQLQEVVKRAQKDATKGKSLLDELKRKAESLIKTNPKSDRLQPYKSQYMRLCKLYVEVMKDHQKSKESLRKSQLDNVVRRAAIAYGGTKTEEELREAAERDPAGLIREAIIEEASEEAQQAYSDAQSRARDVEMLVRSLNEVSALFQDLAVLVQHQSEMLDSIEENVETAGNYVRKGNDAIRTAIETQKKTRKCMCCFICILITVVIALIAGLGSWFGGAIRTA